MKERTSATEKIYRDAEVVAEVLITSACARKFTLMSEDSIRLDFTLMEPIYFNIGDYISDPIFGRFYLADKQMPNYDASTCSYKYQLTFVAPYMLWANHLIMYINTGLDGVKRRHETEWYLTATLSEQLDEVIKNLNILGYTGYTYKIHEDDLESPTKVALMSYNGTSILTALSNMAEEWECEWWVNRTTKVIHFGKCEDSDTDEETFEMGTNVSAMQVSENSDGYFNKVFVYGGETNIPPTYRRDLVIEIGEIKDVTIDGVTKTLYYPKDKKIYLGIEGTQETQTYAIEDGQVIDKRSIYEYTTHADSAEGTIKTKQSYKIESNTISILAQKVTLQYLKKQSETVKSCSGTLTRVVRLYACNADEETLLTSAKSSVAVSETSSGVFYYTIPKVTLSYNNAMTMLPGTLYFRIEVDITLITEIGSGNITIAGMDNYETGDITLTVTPSESTALQNTVIQYNYNGEIVTSDITLNPFGLTKYADDYTSIPEFYAFALTDAGETADGLEVGTICIMDDGGSILVPSAYYQIDVDDPSSVSRIGERRLRLPLKDSEGMETNGYLRQAEINSLTIDTSGAVTYTGDAVIGEIMEFVGKKATYQTSMLVEVNEHTRLSINMVTTYPAEDFDVSPIVWLDDFNEVIDMADLLAEGETKIFNGMYDVPEGAAKCILTYNHGNPNTYITTYNYPTIGEEKEEVVLFEDIYPQARLVITAIETVQMKDKETYEGEDVAKYWMWTQYKLKLGVYKSDGTIGEFKFKKSYLLEGQALQAKFLIASDMPTEFVMPTDGGKLCGMTFDLELDESTQKYTIVTNEDFGCKLPSEILHPTVGDPVTLLGWNVRAMANLGLINDAEKRLLAKGEEYVSAMEESAYTFTCTMMPDWMFGFIDTVNLADKASHLLEDTDSEKLLVKNDFDAYEIPIEGRKVEIVNGALRTSKHSRVIGYELKLDKPYDSAKYTVGETDAYSRLKKIEKELTKK